MAQREARIHAGAAGERGALHRLGDAAAFAALRVVWRVLRRRSPADARRALESVAAVFSRLDGRHRRVVEANLDLAFPQMDSVVRESVLAASFRNWGRLGAEVVHCDALIEEARADPKWEALAAGVAEGMAGGRGLLVLTAHVGNFELLARIFGTLVAPVAVFHRPLGIPQVDAFLVSERQRCGVRTLGRGSVVREAMRILAAGGCVALPLDQNQRLGRGIFVDVLGHPACTSTVLARLSLASGAPVLPVFSVWNGEGGLMPILGEPFAAPARTGGRERDETVRQMTERFSAEVDRVVRRFPHQWNWAHRRWKTRPPTDPIA